MLAVSDAGVLVICAIIGACISAATLVYGWVRDRQKRTADERGQAIGSAAANKERLDDLYVAMVGRPADAEGLPAIEGFVQITERRLARLEEDRP